MDLSFFEFIVFVLIRWHSHRSRTPFRVDNRKRMITHLQFNAINSRLLRMGLRMVVRGSSMDEPYRPLRYMRGIYVLIACGLLIFD